jgi:hypothetical protein
MLQTPAGVRYRVGVWGSDEDSESSNFKEFENAPLKSKYNQETYATQNCSSLQTTAR